MLKLDSNENGNIVGGNLDMYLPAGNLMFKFNNRKTRRRWECRKLKKKTPVSLSLTC